LKCEFFFSQQFVYYVVSLSFFVLFITYNIKKAIQTHTYKKLRNSYAQKHQSNNYQ
jgi:hypothetical protein